MLVAAESHLVATTSRSGNFNGSIFSFVVAIVHGLIIFRFRLLLTSILVDNDQYDVALGHMCAKSQK